MLSRKSFNLTSYMSMV